MSYIREEATPMRSIYEHAKKPDAGSNVPLLPLPEEREFAQLY
jgi:hypothetical protein